MIRQMLFAFFLLFLAGLFLSIKQSQATLKPLVLRVQEREITVNGKKSQVFEIVQSDGTHGLFLWKGARFQVILENHLKSPTGVHWHGLILPNNQDGVPFVTQPPIPPRGKYIYDFPLVQAGTFWMHAHYGLQVQKLLTAPLILYDHSQDQSNSQDVVLFLSDFIFEDPLDVFKELRRQGSKHQSRNRTRHEGTSIKPDLNDVTYDAYLANWRTLKDPDVVTVEPDQEVRLRIINGASSTNFFIHLGELKGEMIAIDGKDIIPFEGSQFEVAVAQRIDVRVKIPHGTKKAYPIIAQGEGVRLQTGLILAMAGAKIPVLEEEAEQAAGALSYTQELRLKAKNPLPQKKIDRHLVLNLEGNMERYIWLLNGKSWPNHDPLMVKEGERVELTFVNQTMVSHPMHLHGHVFQVTEINGQPIAGALRDTMLVLPKATVKVQFDAKYPGNWPLHCHNLYHQYAGMMTTLNYEGFKGPVFQFEED